MRFGVDVEWTGQFTLPLMGARFVLPARLSSDVRPLEMSEMWLLEVVLASKAIRAPHCQAHARFMVDEAPGSWRSPGTELELWRGSSRVATVRVLPPRLSAFSHIGGEPVGRPAQITGSP